MAGAFQRSSFQNTAFQVVLAVALWPAPSQVAHGVVYGPNGNDYVGTLVATGSAGVLFTSCLQVRAEDDTLAIRAAAEEAVRIFTVRQQHVVNEVEDGISVLVAPSEVRVTLKEQTTTVKVSRT